MRVVPYLVLSRAPLAEARRAGGDVFDHDETAWLSLFLRSLWRFALIRARQDEASFNVAS